MQLRQLLCATSTVTAILLLGACASGTTAIADPNVVSKIQVGKSSMGDVEALLGKPSSTQLSENGETVWTYQTVKTNWKGLVPGLNLMGESMKEQNMTLRFTKKGVVKAMGSGQNNL